MIYTAKLSKSSINVKFFYPDKALTTCDFFLFWAVFMFKCGFFIEKHVFLLFFDSLCCLSIYEESFMLGFM